MSINHWWLVISLFLGLTSCHVIEPVCSTDYKTGEIVHHRLSGEPLLIDFRFAGSCDYGVKTRDMKSKYIAEWELQP